MDTRKAMRLMGALCVLLLGCQGIIDEITPPSDNFDPTKPSTNDPISDEDLPPVATATEAKQVPVSGARRLSRTEIDRSLSDLLGISSQFAREFLPEEDQEHEGLYLHWAFENKYTSQNADKVLVQAYERLAGTAAKQAIEDGFVATKLPCTPSGPNDAACLRDFVESFGRQAFRRPMEQEEVTGFMMLAELGEEAGDVAYTVEAMLTAFLQSPDFLYRTETDTNELDGMAGVFKLTDYEVASRMSFFLLGTTPSERLLDMAEAGELSSPEGRASAFAMMMEQPAARDQIDDFHAQWLGYRQLPHSPELISQMRQETRALLERVIFDEQAPYVDIFRTDETFVSPELAEHYGLGSPGDSSGWVPYGEHRSGILSHGTVLGALASGGDTSVTRRGVFVRERLLCEELGPLPDNVNADDLPEAECKSEVVALHNQGGCASCHQLMDPVGWGLENFDLQGRFRAHDIDKPQCPVDGQGSLGRMGDFSGPGELSNLLADNGVTDCAIRYVVRFALGREETSEDLPYIRGLVRELGPDFQYLELLESIVTSERFALRRQEESQ